MPKYDSPLTNLKIASPCSADWNEMAGDERKRFCGDCKLNVYNLSGMTGYDAENLLRNAEGRLCVRYFQRSDGTILTQECPVGWAKIRQKLSVSATALFSILFSLAGMVFLHTASASGDREIMGAIPVSASGPANNLNNANNATMGAVAYPVARGNTPVMGEVSEIDRF